MEWDGEATMKNIVTLHVSVWVEIKDITAATEKGERHAPRERVSWNLWGLMKTCVLWGHAPRERVSWNAIRISSTHFVVVTLHVSVWVEIMRVQQNAERESVTLHLSVWVEISGGKCAVPKPLVTLHVSVWVEINQMIKDRAKELVTLHVSVWVEIALLHISSYAV